MNEELIREIQNAIAELLQQVQSRTEPLSEESKLQLADLLQLAADRIEELSQIPQEPEPSTEPEIPDEARLLWILSGGDRNIFMQYLQSFPSNVTQQLLNDLPRLQMILNWLNTNMPQGERNVEMQGTEQSPIPSSNVWGFAFDPKTGKLRVKFNGKEQMDNGPVYEYSGVPPRIFELFAMGAIPAKTNGQNRWGRWWRGKQPSVGASLHQLIKLAGFPYERVA